MGWYFQEFRYLAKSKFPKSWPTLIWFSARHVCIDTYSLQDEDSSFLIYIFFPFLYILCMYIWICKIWDIWGQGSNQFRVSLPDTIVISVVRLRIITLYILVISWLWYMNFCKLCNMFETQLQEIFYEVNLHPNATPTLDSSRQCNWETR